MGRRGREARPLAGAHLRLPPDAARNRHPSGDDHDSADTPRRMAPSCTLVQPRPPRRGDHGHADPAAQDVSGADVFATLVAAKIAEREQLVNSGGASMLVAIERLLD